jgi:endonuclease-3 related protein
VSPARPGTDARVDPGLAPTTLTGPDGPRVGTPFRFPLRRFSREPGLERVMQMLQRGFGPQAWWPARTPFEVVLGAVLTQNTRWRNVELALERLRRARRTTPARILACEADELAELVRPAGTFRVKARRLRAVSRWYLDQGGLRALSERPLDEVRDALLGVTGIGPETADSILCYAAGRPTPVVDAYARRVLGRHGLVDPELPYEELRVWLRERLVRSQAVIEEFHALCVRAGADHCNPTPRCETCPVDTPAPPPLL